MVELNNFPMTRYQHCYSVGCKMYWYAKEVWRWDEQRCRDMFVLGNLHDIGYAFDGGKGIDGVALAETMKSYYPYADEILYHAKYQENCVSDEMKLLYYADMTVDGKGNWVTVDERLSDLISRYGKESEVVIESIEIADKLEEWGMLKHDIDYCMEEEIDVVRA